MRAQAISEPVRSGGRRIEVQVQNVRARQSVTSVTQYHGQTISGDHRSVPVECLVTVVLKAP